MALQYELFYVIGDSKETEVERIKGSVGTLVEKQGGTWLEKEVTEKRKLAYPIKKEIRGTYFAKRFTLSDRDEQAESAEPVNPINALTRELHLISDVLRFIIVRAETLPSLDSREEALKNMPVAQVYPRRREGGQRGRPLTAARELPAAPKTPPVVSDAATGAKVSDEEIDKQLGEVLDI